MIARPALVGSVHCNRRAVLPGLEVSSARHAPGGFDVASGCDPRARIRSLGGTSRCDPLVLPESGESRYGNGSAQEPMRARICANLQRVEMPHNA